MLRSLYSGISGMKVNQTRMDVIGNNIANVGTTSFKGGRVRFQDMISQSLTSAMGPAANQGGINASQVGLGVQLAGIDTMMRQGMLQPTGRNLDVAVDGEGFFIVGKGPTVFDDAVDIDRSIGNHTVDNSTLGDINMNLMFSRDGSFTLDSEGNLLTSEGYRVMGYSVSVSGSDDESIAPAGDINFVDASKLLVANDTKLNTLRIPDKVIDGGEERRIITFSIDKEGVIKGVLEDGRVTAIGQIAMASFKNPAGLLKLGGNLYQSSVNSGDPALRSGTGVVGPDSNNGGYGDILQGMVEMSNVDLAEQFTDLIVTSRSFQAASRMISSGDEILQEIINLKR